MNMAKARQERRTAHGPTVVHGHREGPHGSSDAGKGILVALPLGAALWGLLTLLVYVSYLAVS